MVLFVIAGHGAGDSGAVGNGYQEQERVRALATVLKSLAPNDVQLGNFNVNYFASGAISNLNLPQGTQILELHLDSAVSSAKGGHVLINPAFNPDAIDNALAAYVGSYFPGRSQTLRKQSLGNASRAAAKGYPYRLLECCFISNAEDMKRFNSTMTEFAKGILRVFGIGVSGNAVAPTPHPSTGSSGSGGKSLDQIANEVIAGSWGNNPERVQKLTAVGYDANAVQNRVNQLLGAGGSSTPKPSINLDQIANEVINGQWGNGAGRMNRLASAGYDANAVQSLVNQKLGAGGSSSGGKSIDTIAQEVVRGDWGNGQARTDRLREAGYDADAVQRRVNQLLS